MFDNIRLRTPLIILAVTLLSVGTIFLTQSSNPDPKNVSKLKEQKSASRSDVMILDTVLKINIEKPGMGQMEIYFLGHQKRCAAIFS